MSNLLPNYDRWLDEPFQREMDARVEEEEDPDEEVCSISECDEPRKPGDSLCAECAEVRNEARATYRQPYSRKEIMDAYSDPTERAKRECLSHLDSIWIR